MGPDLQILEATREHALELAGRMRAEDAAEVLASGGYSPIEALEAAMAHSTISGTLLIRGEVAAMFGLSAMPDDPSVGVPWLLTGEPVQRSPKAFFKACRPVLDLMLEHFPVLYQQVDSRYGAAKRWLKRLGFEIQPAAPFGVAGLPFHPVFLRRRHV